MKPDDAFRMIPWSVAEPVGDALVATLAASVLVFGTSPDVVAWIGRFL